MQPLVFCAVGFTSGGPAAALTASAAAAGASAQFAGRNYPDPDGDDVQLLMTAAAQATFTRFPGRLGRARAGSTACSSSST